MAAEAELRDSGGDGGSLLGAALRLSTFLTLTLRAERCVRDAAMVLEAESEDVRGWEVGGGGETAQSLSVKF